MAGGSRTDSAWESWALAGLQVWLELREAVLGAVPLSP